MLMYICTGTRDSSALLLQPRQPHGLLLSQLHLELIPQGGPHIFLLSRQPLRHKQGFGRLLLHASLIPGFLAGARPSFAPHTRRVAHSLMTEQVIETQANRAGVSSKILELP